MAKQFLDATGLLHLWEKINNVFQKKLVSGNNIKTINGASIVGSGNITTPNTTYSRATADTLGLVKIGATGLGSKQYAVQLNDNGQMFVDVPWIAGVQGSFINSNGDTILGSGVGFKLRADDDGLSFHNLDKSGTFITIGHNGNIDDNSGTGWITCTRGDGSGNIIIQAGKISIEDSFEIRRNSISMPIDDSDIGVTINNTNGIKLSMAAALGIIATNESGENVGDATTFWTTNGSMENIDPLTENEINEILV